MSPDPASPYAPPEPAASGPASHAPDHAAPAPSAAPAQHRSSGMLYHLWGWFEAVLHYLQLRAELALAEARDAGSHYGLIAVLCVAALVLLLFAYVFLILTLVFALAEWMDGAHVWIKIMGGATALHILLAITLALWAKSRLKAGVFERTREEFRKDKLWSKTHHQPGPGKI